jgi:hypothetical protein
MSVDPEELRASLGAADSIEAVFIDELCTASELMTRLRENRPEGIDSGWLRRYSQYQNMFHRALKALEQHRKFKAAHPELFPLETVPSANAAPVEPPAEPVPSLEGAWALANHVWRN